MEVRITLLINALRKAFGVLRQNDPLILASSTAFFATFAISPIILLLVNVFSLYLANDKFINQLFRTLSATLGPETAREIESIVKNFQAIESNPWIAIGGSIFLIFVASTLMGVMKHSINKIWQIKPKPERKLKYYSLERGTGIGLLLFTGFLLLISFLIDSMMAVSMDYLASTWPEWVIKSIRVLNSIFSLIVITLWFTVIFKWLPDARITWDVAIGGGLCTGILFSLGKLGLSKLLIHSRIETIFGASSSFALLLLFIFYCAFIIYYGAAFTRTFAEAASSPVCAGKYADAYEEKIIENDILSQT